MKRRTFLKTAASAGAALSLQSCASRLAVNKAGDAAFDVHPFIKNNPGAVFIHLTDIKTKRDTDGIRSTGEKLGNELIIRKGSAAERAKMKVIVKPNWCNARITKGVHIYDKLGSNTDANFVEGWVRGMKNAADGDYFIRECSTPTQWEPTGWAAMAKRNNIDLRDLSSMDIWELTEGRDYNFVKVPNGNVFKKIAYMAPVNQPDTFLVGIAKHKAHGMGITGAVKNLQGLCANTFHKFCTPHDKIMSYYEQAYRDCFHADVAQRIEKLHAKHVEAGIPRWDRPSISSAGWRGGGGIWQEMWTQRMLDSLSVTHANLSMIEGIYSQDGSGFGSGPHEKLGKYEITSRDYMSNMVMFGLDPIRVDIIAHWLAGHEPGNFGIFHNAIERGMSDVLDPHDIPVYLWDEGHATLTQLDSLTRTPLVSYYLGRDYDGQEEPRYHLCNEPFDYSAWKAGNRSADAAPLFRELGGDNDSRRVFDLSLPKRDDVHVAVLNSKGEQVWSLMADDLEPGVHEVVWDGFASPGMYNCYVKGMGWSAKRKVAVYS